MISQRTIQEIFETAKIEDVVGEFVNLKRRGVNLIGLCPFHGEKTPSFTVSPQKNIYKCFGCGEAGNAVNFLMEHEQQSYPEALRYLAKKYGIEIEETQTSKENLEEKQRLESLYIINEFAREYFENQLHSTDIGKSVGLSYFKSRGFREDTIKKFGLGYAPDKQDAFTLYAVHHGHKLELLKNAGLTSQYGRDFFRGRVQFPIRNLSGKVIGFGGRILDSTKKTAKYMNTPESEIYNKSKVLYGAYFAKKTIRKADECVLVEGYTDVISLHQAGIENVVASSGTSLTVEQIRLIKRYTPNVKIIYDGDAAGVKAALRGLDLVLEQDMNVKIVLLPEGEDPDSYVQKVGTAQFKEYIDKEAHDFIIFKTNLILKETANDPVKRATLIKDIIESIGKIPDPIKRSIYVKECAKLLEVSEQILVTEANKVVSNQVRKEQKERQKANDTTTTAPPTSPQNIGKQAKKTLTHEYQEKDIARILIEFGHEVIEEDTTVAQYVLANMEEIIDEFDNKIYGDIVKEYYEAVLKGDTLTEKYFLNHQNKNIQKTAIGLITFPYDYSENWEKKLDKPLQTQLIPKENFKKDAISSVNQFKLRKVVKLYKRNQERLKDLPSSNVAEMMRILKVQKKLGEIRGELAKELKAVVI